MGRKVVIAQQDIKFDITMVKLSTGYYLVTLYSESYTPVDTDFSDYLKYDLPEPPKTKTKYLAYLIFKKKLLPDMNYYGDVCASMVAKSMRRQGIGLLLYNTALGYAKKLKLKGLDSNPYGRGKPADEFWKKWSQGNIKPKSAIKSDIGYAGYDIILNKLG